MEKGDKWSHFRGNNSTCLAHIRQTLYVLTHTSHVLAHTVYVLQDAICALQYVQHMFAGLILCALSVIQDTKYQLFALILLRWSQHNSNI